MGKQATEMLKGTLEGIVLAILSGRPAYGYEITAWLREQGLLRHRRRDRLRAADQDRAARPRRRGEGSLREGAAAQGVLPQRPGQSTPRRVLEDLELPRRTARTAPRRRQIDHGRREVDFRIRSEAAVARSTRRASDSSRELPHGGRRDRAVHHVLRRDRWTATAPASMLEDVADLFERAAADGTPIREIVGDDPVEFVEAFVANYPEGRVDRPGAGAADQRHRARRGRRHRRRRELPMTTQPVQALHVQGLEKSYQDLHVLRGVDFDVARGSIFALLGSNGAGKTTVVKILSTLLKPDAGTATVAGFDVATQAANVRESISLTGQFAAVDEILTGRENLVLMARLRHLKGAGRIADDLLARFQLTDAAERQGGDVLRRHAPPPGHRHEPHRESAGDLPGRADHRARPAGADRGVEQRQGARRAGHDGAAHHAVPGRGRTARRPDRDPARGTDHRERHARRAEAAPPALPRSSTSRSSRPSRTSSSPSSAPAPTAPTMTTAGIGADE